MNQLTRLIVWLSRINHCRGFGIQSPTDYAFVRYVVNEHWPYYAYSQFTGDWLMLKMGKLYFRLANWRQPTKMIADKYQQYFQSGCRKTRFVTNLDVVELARVMIDNRGGYEELLQRTNDQSVVVVEGIYNDKDRWQQIKHDERVRVIFDLYYCGILLFDKKRYKHYYIINF